MFNYSLEVELLELVDPLLGTREELVDPRFGP